MYINDVKQRILLFLGLSSFLVTQSTVTIAQSPDYQKLQQDIAREINLVRTNPKSYIVFLEEYKAHFQGNHIQLRPGLYLETQEGIAAVDEAITFLQNATPLPPLTLSVGMSHGEQDHVQDLGSQGKFGHFGSDGSDVCDRIARYGNYQGSCVENLSLGANQGQTIVMDLIISDGVASRTPRYNLFNPNYTATGIACSYHQSVYEHFCAIAYTETYQEADSAIAEHPQGNSQLIPETTRVEIAETNPSNKAQNTDNNPNNSLQPVNNSKTETITTTSKPQTSQSITTATTSNSDIAATANPDFQRLEQEVLQEMNLVRSNPTAYIPFLEDYKSRFEGNNVKVSETLVIETQEGVAAVEEAIEFLRNTTPVNTFSYSQGMSLGEKDHVQDIGLKGGSSHYSSDGSNACDRMRRYGQPGGEKCAENITYGSQTGRDIVMEFIIDDGVASRGHRHNLFNSIYQVTGISCGVHNSYYKVMCAVSYAESYQDSK